MPPKRSLNSETTNENKKIRPNSKHWSLGLLDSMSDPELQIQSDDLTVTIKDKYPKAKYHFLILPKESISNLKQLTTKHIGLVKHMELVGLELIKQYENVVFKLGYHAEASMHRLHMHVISDDMDSVCLKTKKHWNTFTTEFFLKAKDIREQLEQSGKITLPASAKIKELLDTPLACHKCDLNFKNMPSLKAHLRTHLL